MKVFLLGVAVCLFVGTKGGSAFLLDSDCGTSNPDHAPTIGIYENPWMVKVLNKTYGFEFGGTLITSRFVLTAAHCISLEEMYVHLGDFLVEEPGPDCFSGLCVPRQYVISVDMKIVHSAFDVGQKSSNIGLLRMKSGVVYSDYVRPICLLVDEHLPPGSSFNSTGWGHDLSANNQSGEILLKAILYNTNRSHCTLKYGKHADQSEICVGSNTVDTCKWRLGNLLSAEFAYGGKTLNFQIGLASYGSSKCSTSGALLVYTNVTHYTPWIVDTITRLSN
ncbi:spaetzle-processing enzyme-like [Drosophila biarmipes]|uniref:spaetzle-processing enzyme-like n=1 Tax=Drosophila biarmipes TaxID=125945 RepID=UPI0007E80778|nr:spaetzle-processing enzyme-like [Drosophila biarmipes]